jgi:menaquinone-dependent protoporphyrinogen oxidase
MKCLVIFSSKYGQTEKIATRIADNLRSSGVEVDVQPAETVGKSKHLSDYDLVVVGSPIYFGKHLRTVSQFISENLATLNHKTSAFFSVSLSASGNPKQQSDASRAVDAFLEERGWIPKTTTSFGGALPYRKYGWLTRMLMKWISSREGGSTDTSRDHEYTDLNEVDAFAKELLTIAAADNAQSAQTPLRNFAVN